MERNRPIPSLNEPTYQSTVIHLRKIYRGSASRLLPNQSYSKRPSLRKHYSHSRSESSINVRKLFTNPTESNMSESTSLTTQRVLCQRVLHSPFREYYVREYFTHPSERTMSESTSLTTQRVLCQRVLVSPLREYSTMSEREYSSSQ